MKFGLVPHPKKKGALALSYKILSHFERLEDDGVDVSLTISDYMKGKIETDRFAFRPIEMIKADVNLCIGGDGTLLYSFQHSDNPVIGINIGSLGFLMEIEPNDAIKAVDRLIKKEYIIERRSKIHTLINDEPVPDAANEVVVLTSTPSKIQSFEIYVDMEKVQRIKSDGIIFSTPTGSTCYAMSAGGSILDPRLNVIQMVPISPFNLSLRPIVIPDSSMISLKIMDKRRAATLVIDGFYRRSVKHRDDILMTRSKSVGKLVRFESGFYRRYHEKLVKKVED